MPNLKLQPLRIMHVLSGDLWAGAEVMAHTLICELRHNFDVDVCAVVLNQGELASHLKDDGIKTTVLDETKLSALAILKGLHNTAREHKPDLVHTHRKKENILGGLVAKKVGARSIRTEHGWSEFPDLGLHVGKHLSRQLDVWAGNHLQQRIVAVSDELGERLAGQYDKTRIRVIYNGVDIEMVRKTAATDDSPPSGESRKRRIGIIGRLVPVKRHDRFVKAAIGLLEAGAPDCEFYVIGDGPLRAELQLQIDSSDSAEKFHLLGFRADVLQLLSTLDVLVVSSDHEGVPMNVLEAAALQVPVVSVPLPSVKAVLDSGALGVIAADDTIAALVAAIQAALAGPISPPQPVDTAWAYSSRSMAARYLELYSDVLGPPETGL